MPDTQELRREAFAALLKEDGTDPSDYDEGEEEDPRLYLSGDLPIGRYVCVTVNFSSRGGETLFYLPTFAELDAAQERAVEFVSDDLFEELPIKIVDLDTGSEYYAQPSYKWEFSVPEKAV